MTKFSHAFFSTAMDGIEPPQGRWTSGPSLDGKGEYSTMKLTPMGDEPQLAPPIPEAYAQLEQMQAGKERVAAMGASSKGMAAGGSTSSDGIATRISDSLSTMASHLTGGGTESGTR